MRRRAPALCRLLLSLGIAGSAAPGAVARAQSGKPTPLLSDDIAANRRTRIDQADDSGLDDLVAAGGFSTKDLEKIEDRLRADLAREHLRAPPRLIVFLYPGRVNAAKLREMKDIFVDVELVIDPCERSVCRDAVARHIELVGRAVGTPELRGDGFHLTFKNLTLTAVTGGHGDAVEVYRVPMSDCITAAARPGGGKAWIDNRRKLEDQFEPLAVRSIAQKEAARRVPLVGVPTVTRASGEATVALHLRGDRSRYAQQVLDAMVGAVAGLREQPATPTVVHLEADVDVALGRMETKKFRALGQPVGLFLDGKLDAQTLRDNYIEEVKHEGDRLSFSDDEASGRAPVADAAAPAVAAAAATPRPVPAAAPAPTAPAAAAPEPAALPDPFGDGQPGEEAATAVLSANFDALAACARAETLANKKFTGVTLSFQWMPDGKAARALPKEASLRARPIARCLGIVISRLAFPRFSGAPRSVEYPIGVR